MPNIVRNERSLWAQSVASDWRTISISIRMICSKQAALTSEAKLAPCPLLCSTGWSASRFPKTAFHPWHLDAEVTMWLAAGGYSNRRSAQKVLSKTTGPNLRKLLHLLESGGDGSALEVRKFQRAEICVKFYGIVPSTSPAGSRSVLISPQPLTLLLPAKKTPFAIVSHPPIKLLPVPVNGVFATTQYWVPPVTATGVKFATARAQQVPLSGRFVTVTGPASNVPGMPPASP